MGCLNSKIDFKAKYITKKCKKSLISIITEGRRHFKLFTNCHVSWDT